MAEIIILANSRKLSNRCIAGIDLATNKWIRPVSTLTDKVITWSMRNIDGEELKLLDIIQVPLSLIALDDDSQPENRLIEESKWTYVGKVEPIEVIKYIETRGPLFYNFSDRVSWDEIIKAPSENRKSLLLIECSDLEVHKTKSFNGTPQARATFSFDGIRYNLVVTDFCAEQSIIQGNTISRMCLLTISLAGKMPNTDLCFKLIAGIIEL